MKTVLIIDDNEIDTLISRKVLEKIQHVKEIHSALNGKIALSLLSDYFERKKALPDIIFLDLSMPIMDGFTFIRKFRELPLPGKEKVTIVIVTSSNSQKDMKLAKETGIDLYVTKPVNEDKILKALNIVE